MEWNLERFRDDGTRACSMADALLLVGDRWSFHVIREIGSGSRRFDAIQRHTGAPREMLTSRLRKLETAGVITRERYNERPPRYEYALTAAGEDLIPVMAALYAWGEKYATPTLNKSNLSTDEPAMSRARSSQQFSVRSPNTVQTKPQ